MMKIGVLLGLLGMAIIAIAWITISANRALNSNTTTSEIQPGKKHLQYWIYKGTEVALFGGSVEDYPFNPIHNINYTARRVK